MITGKPVSQNQSLMATEDAYTRTSTSSGLIVGRSSSERLRYYDALMGMLREAGFSDAGAYRTNLVVDSYVYGFALQEVSWPAPESGQTELESAFLEGSAGDEYPNLMAAAALHADGKIDIAVDFEVCLDLILDSLERLRERDLGA